MMNKLCERCFVLIDRACGAALRRVCGGCDGPALLQCVMMMVSVA